MATERDPEIRAVDAARRAAELRRRPDGPDEGRPVTRQDVEDAEHRAEQARRAAAAAARSAAGSLETSARLHERLAAVEDETIQQGVGNADVMRESACFHRQSAAADHKLAELKRQEAEADDR
ncbi:hypothetical protein [Mycobacterium simiae]|uniref:hypothetical protein n=1 Tax=Mycobacterium simiae TaxID=1784 RepID=UPI00042491A6|nr:hypothetical protein [Mycobacterium simiae]PLV47651.1 hypothetical protein X011_20105 [Mycobacterium tuberculosis variant microti OV254]BBX41553.1 hypothetical protein MSIM_30040 [Mycobacterium simiae]